MHGPLQPLRHRCDDAAMSATDGNAAPDLPSVRVGTPADAAVTGKMLHDFNAEFGDHTPGAEALGARLEELVAAGEATVLLTGEPPVGFAVLRFRPALWAPGLDADLEELYVRPEDRGEGYGRALLTTALDLARERGAIYMHLATGETDREARRLYERNGFSNVDEGVLLFYYERDL